MKTINIGDVVRLKSGGPWMTVANYNPKADGALVLVMWMCQRGLMQSHCLMPALLETEEKQ